MSKLQNIKNAVKEGKGSVKMIEYLLWRDEQLRFINRQLHRLAGLMPVEANGHRQQIGLLERILNEVDTGESPMSRYEFVLENYKELYP